MSVRQKNQELALRKAKEQLKLIKVASRSAVGNGNVGREW